MDSNIKYIVEIVLEVSKQVQAKRDLELKLANDELAEANAEIDELREQKDRQAKTIQELMEKLENTDGLADDYYQSLESLNEKMNAQEDYIQQIEKSNNALSEKLNRAQDWIQRQNSKIAKLETQPPAEPEWIKPTDDEPQDGVDVLVTTVRGSIVIARLTSGGWKNKVTGAILTDPRAWMALPEPFEEE